MCLETQYLYNEGKEVSQIKQRLGISHFYQAPPRAATQIGDPSWTLEGTSSFVNPPVSVVYQYQNNLSSYSKTYNNINISTHTIF